MPRNWLKNKKRKSGRKAKSKASTMTFSKRVLSVLDTQRELKVAVLHGELPITGTINGQSILQVMPNVPQAGNTGSANAAAQEFYRDGNSITLKKIKIRDRHQCPIVPD